MSLESKTLYTTKEEIHYEISSHRLKYREGTPTTIHAYFFQLIGGQVLAACLAHMWWQSLMLKKIILASTLHWSSNCFFYQYITYLFWGNEIIRPKSINCCLSILHIFNKIGLELDLWCLMKRAGSQFFFATDCRQKYATSLIDCLCAHRLARINHNLSPSTTTITTKYDCLLQHSVCIMQQHPHIYSRPENCANGFEQGLNRLQYILQHYI